MRRTILFSMFLMFLFSLTSVLANPLPIPDVDQQNGNESIVNFILSMPDVKKEIDKQKNEGYSFIGASIMHKLENSFSVYVTFEKKNADGEIVANEQFYVDVDVTIKYPE